MAEEDKKSWWQTAGGLMAGAAALVTAVTGSIVSLHQMLKGSDDGKQSVAQQSAPMHESSSDDSSRSSVRDSGPAGTTPASPAKADSETGAKSGPQQVSSAPVAKAPAGDRPTYSVPLPAKHEFVLGAGLQTGRFILTGVSLESHTAESDILKVSVQVVVDGQQQFPFNSMQFELRIDEQPYKSTTYFNEFIPVGQSRDHALHFTIPHGPTRAVLWIHEWMSNAEIPLDITPAAAVAASK